MLWARRFWLRLQTLFGRKQNAQRLDTEIQFHLDQQIAENVAAGMNPQEARYAAMRAFGNPTFLKEETRDTWGWTWLEQIAQDLHYGFRTLRYSPSFTAIAVLTLALGIGITASVLTVCRATILQPLAVPEPDRVVQLFFSTDRSSDTKFTFPGYLDLRGNAIVFTGLAAHHETRAGITERPSSAGPAPTDSHSQLASVALVSGSYFALLGGKTTIGRTFGPDEDLAPGAHPVMVLSYPFWKSHLGADASVLGRTMSVNGHPFTVVGVATPNFHGINPGWPDAWIPLAMQNQVEPGFDGLRDGLRSNWGRWLHLVGRLAPGVRVEQAQAAMRLVAHRWEEENPGWKNAQILVTAGSELNAEGRGRILPIVSLAFIGVGLVLLVACANTSNLLLARGLSRQREIGLRLALGASRGRLVRQMLTEGALLSLVAGIAGLLLSQWTTRAMYLVVSRVLPVALDFQIDGWVLAVTMAISLATVVVFGLAPALQATRLNVVPALKEEGSTLHERVGASRLRNVLLRDRWRSR